MQKGIDFVGVGVVYFCHNGKGSFVMHKRGQQARDEQGNWDIGGGAMEVGDSVEATLKKEIKEEYCAEVLSYEFLGYRDFFRKHENKTTHWVTLDFKVLVDPKQVKNGEPHKFEDVQWFTLATLPSPVHSQIPVFLEKYKDRL